jgi:hypothetical protein
MMASGQRRDGGGSGAPLEGSRRGSGRSGMSTLAGLRDASTLPPTNRGRNRVVGVRDENLDDPIPRGLGI